MLYQAPPVVAFQLIFWQHKPQQSLLLSIDSKCKCSVTPNKCFTTISASISTARVNQSGDNAVGKLYFCVALPLSRKDKSASNSSYKLNCCRVPSAKLNVIVEVKKFTINAPNSPWIVIPHSCSR